MLTILLPLRGLSQMTSAVAVRTATTGPVLLLLGLVTVAQAQVIGPIVRIFGTYAEVYSVKFACGTVTDDGPVLRGVYRTTINVHNPNYYPAVAHFQKKVSLTYPAPQQKPGPVSPYRSDTLGADQSLQIDCADIATFLRTPTPAFYEGFLVIESWSGVRRAGLILFLPRPVPLDVVAVYTARPSGTEAESIHVERYPSRTQYITSPFLGLDKNVYSTAQRTYKLGFMGPPNVPVKLLGFQEGRKAFEGPAGNTDRDGLLILTGGFEKEHIGKWRILAYFADPKVEGNELESNEVEFEVIP